AQRDAAMRNKRLAAAIVDLGLMNERRFAEWIAKATQISLVDPLPAGAVAQLQHRIPPQIARDYQIVPVAIDRDSITIAMMNPLDQACLDLVRKTTGMSVRPVIGLYSALLELLNRTYPEQDADTTMLRRPPANATPAKPPKPIDEATTAVLAIPEIPPVPPKQPNEAEVTTEARAILPMPPTLEVPPPKESQLDRIERGLIELQRAIEKLQRRVDAMDTAIARSLTRK
ncbi:MAG: GspE/PulE/PilB domain-containing protein, partial [Thermoanaerobaculia bacterium]